MTKQIIPDPRDTHLSFKDAALNCEIASPGVNPRDVGRVTQL